MLKDDFELFSELQIVAEHKDCDMASFLKHENQHCPPSLSDYSKLEFPKKLVVHIVAQECQQDPPSAFDDIAYDSAA